MSKEALSIIDKGSYLLVEFFGEFSVENGKQCVDSMTRACESRDRSKVMLDCRRMTGMMSIFDRFQVAEYGASKQRQIRQLALLNREEIVQPDNFVENVADNRGMNMKIFTKFDEAELWLNNSAPESP